jgi:hypothetical protein
MISSMPFVVCGSVGCALGFLRSLANYPMRHRECVLRLFISKLSRVNIPLGTVIQYDARSRRNPFVILPFSRQAESKIYHPCRVATVAYEEEYLVVFGYTIFFYVGINMLSVRFQSTLCALFLILFLLGLVFLLVPPTGVARTSRYISYRLTSSSL